VTSEQPVSSFEAGPDRGGLSCEDGGYAL